MKNLLLFLSLNLCLNTIEAKDLLFDFDSHITIKKNFVLEDELGLKKELIPFKFGKTETSFNEELIHKIPPKRIRRIIYVYSHNKDQDFQEKLNKNRIDTLTRFFGKRIKNLKDVTFETIIVEKEHLDPSSFNGFVIVYELSARQNQMLFKAAMEGKRSGVKTGFVFDTLISYNYVVPHVYLDLTPKSIASKDEVNIVKSVLERNEWKNRLIVVDVTGSMMPYISQYLLWLKLTFDEKENQRFVFFNDGNTNYKKPIGKTGGLYFSGNNLGYEHILKTIQLAMRNGGGGDCPENNIEAVIKGLKKNSKYEVDEVIMVADNWATPRDVELINEVGKPIRIILCGTRGKVNVEYLKLAHKSGGSIHTIEEDLENICKLKEGEKLSFMGIEYIIEKGEIKPLILD